MRGSGYGYMADGVRAERAVRIIARFADLRPFCTVAWAPGSSPDWPTRAFRPADLRDWLVLALISDDWAQLTQLEIATQRDAAISDRLAAISLSERANFHATLWRIVGGAATQT